MGEMILMRRISIMLLLIGVLLIGQSGIAEAQQIKCEEVVKRALQQIKDKCANMPRNMVCYANGNASLETVSTATKTVFQSPGDMVALSAMKRINLAPYDEKTGTWGLVMLRVQASFPDSQPGQFVSMMLMGDVQIDNLANKDSKPGAQAFIFKSGTATLACKQLPPNGILLESPKGKQRAKLTMNGAELDIGSKVFLQTTAKTDKKPKPQFVVKTLEGLVNLTAKGKTTAIKPKQESEVDLTENYEIDGVPNDAATFDSADDDALPVETLGELDQGTMDNSETEGTDTEIKRPFNEPTSSDPDASE